MADIILYLLIVAMWVGIAFAVRKAFTFPLVRNSFNQSPNDVLNAFKQRDWSKVFKGLVPVFAILMSLILMIVPIYLSAQIFSQISFLQDITNIYISFLMYLVLPLMGLMGYIMFAAAISNTLSKDSNPK